MFLIGFAKEKSQRAHAHSAISGILATEGDFSGEWVEFIIIGVYISLREEVGVLLEEPASMIANPLFSLISWFRKQYCHKHKYKYTNIIVNPIFSLVFSYQMLTKTVFLLSHISAHYGLWSNYQKHWLQGIFFSLCYIHSENSHFATIVAFLPIFTDCVSNDDLDCWSVTGPFGTTLNGFLTPMDPSNSNLTQSQYQLSLIPPVRLCILL